MKEYLRKFKSILRSPGLAAVMRWSQCVHGRIVLICFLTVVSTLLSLGYPIATKGLVDGAVSSNLDGLKKSAILLVVLIFVSRGLGVIRVLIRINTSTMLQKSLQSMLVSEILKKEYSKLKNYHSGELVNRLFSDVSIIQGGVINILPSLISAAVSFIGAAIILITMDWHFVILMVIGGLLGVALILLFKKPLKERHKRMQEAEGALHASAQETLENIRLIKSSGSEQRMQKRMEVDQEHLRTEQIRQGIFRFRMDNSMGLVFDLSWLFCMVWGCLNIFQGNLTYGSLAAMIQLIGRIQGPITSAVSIAGQAYGVTSSAERLLELTELPDEEHGTELTEFDSISLEDITFHYEDSADEVLQSINWTIHKGDFMALTGMSGGGKTSLFQLLLGIYQPTSGRVLFRKGETEVPASNGTRRLFAYVPQGNTLFSGTLRDNLTMFTDQATDEEIMEVAKAACIDHVVREIGLDAVLGERGVGLSEGQAQRVAVARALLSRAPILLFDEATSALDEKTEAHLLENISAMRDKTCIIVTHRRAALEICDYTLHLVDGKMVEAE